jgi:cell division septation protein DedD
MEETTTSWKNHSFTLLIFGGIVVLCSIFFVLGMLVGRNQGQQIAEMRFAEDKKNKPVSVAGSDDLKLNYYVETTEPKADLRLQPEPPAAEPGIAAAPVKSGSSSTPNRSDTPSTKPPAADKTSATAKATPKPAAAKTPAPTSKDTYLQVLATKNEKQAKAELKKVQSKGFPKALIMEVTLKNERWHRVMVGPYKESEVSLAQSDLKAKGYKDVILQK